MGEVDPETGSVVSTRQFRKALSELAPTPIINWNNGKYGFGGEHGFSSLNSNTNGITITHSQTGRIYLLDMKNSGIVAWTSVSPSNINKTYIQGNLAVVLDTSGVVRTISFNPLVDLVQSSFELEKFVLCSDILLSNRNAIKSLPYSDISRILSMRNLVTHLSDKDKIAKVKRLMDAMDTFVGKSLTRVYTRQISSEQILANSGHRERDYRSMSQDRRMGLHASNEILSSDEPFQLKSQSQEDLLDGHERTKSSSQLSKRLSRSKKNMSASEQGLQALQLYNIKCKTRSLQPSPNQSRNISRERLGYGSRRNSFKKHHSGSESNSSQNVSTERLEQITAEVASELTEKLIAQAMAAGIDIDMDKVASEAIDGIVNESLGVQGVPSRQHENGRSKSNYPRDHEVCSYSEAEQESEFPITDWEYGKFGSLMDDGENFYGADVLGDSITLGFEKLLETGTKIASEAKFTNLLTSIQELDSPKLGMAGRANKEIELTVHKKKIEEIAITAKNLSELGIADSEFVDTIRKLSRLIVEEYSQKCKSNSSESLSCSSETETNEFMPECLGISSYLTKDKIEDLEQAFNLIFSSDFNREIFFRPMQDISMTVHPVSHAYSKLVTIFEEKFIEFDRLIASALVLFSDVIDCDTILKNLKETDFFTYQYLLSLEEKHNPNLAPIRLEQIDDQNINECANFLSNYTGFSTFDLLRYLSHMAKIDTECSVHVVQSLVLDIPPHCLLFLLFTYYEALMEAASTTLTVNIELNTALSQDFSHFLVKSLSPHIPGWASQWKQVFEKHKYFNSFIVESFTIANESRLSKSASLVGGHKNIEGLETAILGDFLIKQHELGPREAVLFCRQTFYLAGLVRSVLRDTELALQEMPFIIELGDTGLLAECGLLDPPHAHKVVDHLVAVYYPAKDLTAECPINWEQLARQLLNTSGPDLTIQLLREAAGCLKPGTFSRRLYAEMIVLSVRANRQHGRP